MTVVVACSGPSLDVAEISRHPYPICAISTAIRSVPSPAIWSFVDRLNAYHGPEGAAALECREILKVVPSNRVKLLKANRRPDVRHAQRSNRRDDKAFTFMSQKQPLLSGHQQSVTFAVQSDAARRNRV